MPTPQEGEKGAVLNGADSVQVFADVDELKNHAKSFDAKDKILVGERGLGDEVLLGLQQLNVGRAAEAGIAIVLLAIVLDRITQSYGETLQERQAPVKKVKK